MINKKNKYFGVIEGFFSEPIPVWTNEERINTLNFISACAPEINSYLYCPKDDYYVTKGWDKPYPKEKIKEIETIIKLCKSKNMTYTYGLNPVVSKDTAPLVLNRIKQLKKVGCEDFCLLFDDLPVAYDVIEGSYSDNLSNFSKLLTQTINQIYDEVKKSVNNFWVCSPDYCFKQRTPLTENLKSLNPNISLFWSGNEVFSRSISIKDFQRIKNLLGYDRKIILWSNYPVNDCEQNVGVYNFGSFYPLNQTVVNNLSGIFVNPMREPFASLPFYITFSDFLTNKNKYSRSVSWRRALNLVSNNKKYKMLFESYQKAIRKNIEKRSEIKRLIFGDKQITYKKFCEMDIFPTNPNVARYYIEIVEIVLKRLSLIPNVPFPKVKAEWFNQKYCGRKKLSISKTDEKKILSMIKSLIAFERKQFVRLINNKSIDPKVRLTIIRERQKINRFTVNKI